MKMQTKLNQTGVGQAGSAPRAKLAPRTLPFEKGGAFKASPFYREIQKHAFSNRISIISIVLWSLVAFPPYALGVVSEGSADDCHNSAPPDYDVELHKKNAQSSALALLDYLENHVEKAAIVARAGGDISTENFRNPSHQKYTHAGIVYKSHKESPWRFKHILNICAGENSGIFDQNLVQFFNDGPHFYDFRIGVPSSFLQDSIVAVLESNLAEALHNPRYSNIANPFHTEYQNSNGWVLNILTAAQYPNMSSHLSVAIANMNLKSEGHSNEQELLKARERIQDYYKDHFVPSQVQVGKLRSFFSNFVSNATTRDHTQEEKASGWYNFVSTVALFQYLQRTDDVVDIREICHSKGCNIPFAKLNKQKKRQSNHSEREESH